MYNIYIYYPCVTGTVLPDTHISSHPCHDVQFRHHGILCHSSSWQRRQDQARCLGGLGTFYQGEIETMMNGTGQQ